MMNAMSSSGGGGGRNAKLPPMNASSKTRNLKTATSGSGIGGGTSSIKMRTNNSITDNDTIPTVRAGGGYNN